jgi:hypothetical protein
MLRVDGAFGVIGRPAISSFPARSVLSGGGRKNRRWSVLSKHLRAFRAGPPARSRSDRLHYARWIRCAPGGRAVLSMARIVTVSGSAAAPATCHFDKRRSIRDERELANMAGPIESCQLQVEEKYGFIAPGPRARASACVRGYSGFL